YTQTLTVLDDEAPVFTNCPTDFTINTDAGICEATLTWEELMVTDNCPNYVTTNDLATILAQYNGNLAPVLAAIPSRFVLENDIENNNNFDDGGADVYDNANFMNTNFATDIPYSENIITTSNAFGTNSAYFTSYNSGVWMMAADLNNVDFYEITGNNGADGDGTANVYQGSYTAPLSGVTYYAYVKRIYNGNDPSINHLFIIEDNTGVTQTFATDTNDDQHRISGLNGNTRIYQFNWYGADPNDDDIAYNYSDTETQAIFEAFVDNVVDYDISQVSGPTQVAGPPPGSTFSAGTTTITYEATDASGNVGICSFTVTVNDVTPPEARCQNVTVQLDATGNGSTTPAAVDDGSTDNCGIATLALDVMDFTCANVGANTVTLTVTDDSDNTDTADCTVTVEDNVLPEALCQNVTVQLDANGNGSTTAADVDNGSNDACGIQSLALSQTDFTCADVGVNTVTLTVTDNNDNVNTTDCTVTVEDNVLPEALCQNVTVQLDATGNGSTTAADVDNGSNDACGIMSLALSRTDFTCADVGANTVTLTVTDNNSNVNTTDCTVTVEDNVLPEALCQNVTVQSSRVRSAI
ncbi:MAG: HYR domain-containing protein, partial [Bacteroidota bacterium]